jgi:hypothetical protein
MVDFGLVRAGIALCHPPPRTILTHSSLKRLESRLCPTIPRLGMESDTKSR